MAIAFGAGLGQVTGAAVSTVNIGSLQVNATDSMIVVGLQFETVTVDVSTLKYDDGAGGGEQSFTQIGTYQNVEAGNYRISLWRLVTPNTGSGRRIILTMTGNSNVNMGAAYWTGIDQTTPTNDPTNGNDTASPAATTNTSNIDGSWQMSLLFGAASLAVTSGGIKRWDIQNAADISFLADSNTTVANTVSNTINFSWNDGTDGGFVSCMIRPSATPAGATASTAGRDFMLMGAN